MAARRGSSPSWLYIFIVLILGATLIAGVVSWIWLTFEDKQMPDGRAGRGERAPGPGDGDLGRDA
jgi:hypothetical protein